MIPSVVIRAATAADRVPVLRIAATAMQEHGIQPDFSGLDADLGRIGTGAEENIVERVAVLEGEVCGSIVVSAKGPGRAKLGGFYVDATQRGHGFGRRLLEAAVQAAAEAGYDELTLETWGRMTAAVRLYESAGWVRGTDLPPASGADRTYSLSLRERRATRVVR